MYCNSLCEVVFMKTQSGLHPIKKSALGSAFTVYDGLPWIHCRQPLGTTHPNAVFCHMFTFHPETSEVGTFSWSIVHFTVTGGNEAGVDLVLIQPFLLCYVNHVVLMLNSIF